MPALQPSAHIWWQLAWPVSVPVVLPAGHASQSLAPPVGLPGSEYLSTGHSVQLAEAVKENFPSGQPAHKPLLATNMGAWQYSQATDSATERLPAAQSAQEVRAS
jgi:hypothetical protein